MVGCGYVYIDRFGTTHVYGLVVHLGSQPPALELIQWRVPISKPLYVQVLVVGHSVGDAPGYLLVVPEVRKPRHAGEGQTHHVEVGAGQVVLVINVGCVQGPVGVSRQERLAGGRPRPGQDPAIAARIGLS